MANKTADEGNLWVCQACGKTSKDRYGFDGADPGWDESCMLNSMEVQKSRLVFSEGGRVIEIKPKVSDGEL